MIYETWEQKQENNQIRIKIISKVMEITNERYLESIYNFARSLDKEEWKQRPWDIMSIAMMLDEEDVKRVLSAINEADMAQTAAVQIKEAFEAVLQENNA